MAEKQRDAWRQSSGALARKRIETARRQGHQEDPSSIFHLSVDLRDDKYLLRQTDITKHGTALLRGVLGVVAVQLASPAPHGRVTHTDA